MKTDSHLMDVSAVSNEAITDISNNSLIDFNSVNRNSLGKNFVYNEMSDYPVRSRTEVESLKENMMVLNDLTDRLSFLSKEVKYLLNLK